MFYLNSEISSPSPKLKPTSIDSKRLPRVMNNSEILHYIKEVSNC